MPNYLPFQGAENVSVPDDLNGEMPVQRFAFGGIANPSQQPFLSKADREYLQARQVDLDKLAEYDRAVEAYNRDVYAPYEKAYGEYEKAINAWNEGPRTTDYAGPAAPTLSPFTIAKPEVSFDPQAVVAFQKAAAARAQEAAGQRGLAIDVVSDPGRYNLGALSVSNAFMAEGGEVKSKASEDLARFRLGGSVKVSGGQSSSSRKLSAASMKRLDSRYQNLSGTLSAQEESLKQQLANPADYRLAAGDLRELESRLGGVQQQRGNLDAEMQMRMANAARLAQEAKPKYDLEAEMQVVVYGPDGKMYSSPRAARDAGVTNYTTIPPKSSPVTQPPPGIDTRVGPPLPPPGGMPIFNPNDPFRDINNPRPVSPPPGGMLPGPVMGPPAPTPPAPAPAPAPAPTPAPPPAPTPTPTPSPVSPVPSPFTPVPTPRPAPTPPSAGYLPGTIRYNPVLTYQGPTAVDLLQQNPSLAPKPAGGLPNMGYTTDRLGNIIRAPMAIPVFAQGGDVDTNELLQRVNEYNLYGDDPAYYSESRNMLQELPGVSETSYSESPSTQTVKRITKRPLEAKSSEGFGKGMAMEVESLTTSKGTSPKALKGTAREDFKELARTYKLKAKEAENMARGLSRDTFGAPTLERPTLTKGSLTKRRFEEGGEVKKSSEESEKEAGRQFDDPIRSGKPLQRRTRRAATQEENEALNRAVLQGAANMPYNLVGAPVDIANMVLTPAGLGSERPVMGSDWIKQKMTDLGVRPEMPTDPTQRALYSAADIGSSLVNPAAPVRAAAKGAEKAGEAARMLAEDFQQYNRALGPAGASQLTTWHGSPYPFKNFDPAKIGTGEGRQAYSQGYYSAEARPVAEGYQRDISRKKIVQEFRKELPDDASFEEALEAAENMSPPAANLIRALSADDWLGFDYPSQAISAALRDLNNFEPSDALRKAVQDAQGYMYKIDIPDEAVAKMLDWDKPLGQQSQTIQDIGKGLGLSMDDLGGDLIAAAGAKTRAGAERLRQAGIPGVRYLDAQSRGGKKLETQNFVVFPGNEDLMRILERNDQPIEGLAKGGPVNTSTAKGQLAKLKAA